MEAIEVTARFDSAGKITPVEFRWQGRVFPVDSTGRRWEDERGKHILVMIPGGRVYELIFEPQEGRWYLLRTGADRMSA
jgi:hypothetical protein